MTVSDYTDLIKRQYNRSAQEAKAHLDAKSDLPDKLRALRLHQLAAGFIRDDLTAVTRCRIIDPAGHRHFVVQHNPRRAERHAGAGRTQPPPEVVSINGNCFLCPDTFGGSSAVWRSGTTSPSTNAPI